MPHLGGLGYSEKLYLRGELWVLFHHRVHGIFIFLSVHTELYRIHECWRWPLVYIYLAIFSNAVACSSFEFISLFTQKK